MHHNFYDWWTHSNDKNMPPFGTPRTTIWIGPPDQVEVLVLTDFKMESSEEGLIVYSPLELTVLFMTQVTVNGVIYRMAYSPAIDTVYASQNSYLPTAEVTDDLEAE